MRSPRVASATVFLLSVSLLTGCATVNRWWSWLFPTSKEPITSTTAPGAPQTPMPSAVVIATPDTAVNAVNQADSAGKPAGSNFDSATDPAPAATQSSSFVDVADQAEPARAPAPPLSAPSQTSAYRPAPPKPAQSKQQAPTPRRPPPAASETTPRARTLNPGCNEAVRPYMQDYVDTGTSYAPDCLKFANVIPTDLFTTKEYAQHNYDGGGAYAWFLINPSLVGGLRRLNEDLMKYYKENYGQEWVQLPTHHKAIFQVTGGYRKPGYQKQHFTAWENRHIYGDAIDVDNVFGTRTRTLQGQKPLQYEYLKIAAYRTCACVEPARMTKLTHMHFDWRMHRKAYTSGVCNANWAPSNILLLAGAACID